MTDARSLRAIAELLDMRVNDIARLGGLDPSDASRVLRGHPRYPGQVRAVRRALADALARGGE